MISHWKRIIAVVLFIPTMMILLTGCWDNQEIDSLFIITGVGLDELAEEKEPAQLDITVQVGSTGQSSAGGEDSGAKNQSVIIMKTYCDTVMGGLSKLNRNSDHRLLLHHNQVLVFGSEIAKKGIKQHIDLFLRDQQARVEVPIVISESTAEEIMSADLEQDPISGKFLAGMLDDLSKKSVEYRVRLIDFVSNLLDGNTCPAIPIVKLVENNGEQEVQISGMGVFKDGKMTGRLAVDEIPGYLYSMGSVKQCNVEVEDGSNRAVFHIATLKTKRDVSLREDGGVKISLSVNAVLNIGELTGFKDMKPDELLLHLVNLAQERIKQDIEETFTTARNLDADIFGYGTSVYRKYPNEWKAMKSQWDELFKDIDLDINAQVKIPGTGQIVQSLEIEENLE